MLKNLWNKISFYCIHNHVVPIPMHVQEGPSSPFYACPNYFEQNRKEGEKPCGNRLNFIDAENLVAKFAEIIEQDIITGAVSDFTGMEFDYKSIHVKVIFYSDEKIKLGILNKKALR